MKKYAQMILWFIVVVHSIAFLAACSDRQPARVAWISVEKPPIKVVYIDRQGELDPVITTKIFNIVGRTRAINMQVNDNTGVTLNANSHQSDTESDSDISSTTLSR